MKKVLVFFIVVMVIFGVCSAQRVDAQSANIAQKIIGTWVDTDGDTWVFNANGTGTYRNGTCKFAVADTKLAIEIGRDHFAIFDVSISSDGKTLIFSMGNGKGYWLTKK
jgi:hypothetical protein